MNSEHAPFVIGSLQISQEALLPVALIAIVAVFLMFSVRRELAAFAIAASVLGALMLS